MASEPSVQPDQIRQICARDLGLSVVEKFGLDVSVCEQVVQGMIARMGFNCGWIEAICGPMFSGKSEELIRRLRRAIIARSRVQVFKPAIDTRYADCDIVTHGAVRMPCEPVQNAGEILQKLNWRTQVVGIDEANFFGPPLVAVADQLADSGKQVIVAGLDTDYLGRPFPPMPDLLAIAESITKTLAVCMRCGKQAKHTQRLIQSDELIVVGASDAYEARCRVCFEPGSPTQETLDFGSGEPLNEQTTAN